MGEFKDLAAQFDQVNQKRKGDQFEAVCKWFLENDTTQYKALLRRVWLWGDWPGRWSNVDAGIDLVAEDFEGRLWAIQCKGYADNIDREEVNKFLAEASRPVFSYRILMATTDSVSPIARRTMEDLGISFLGPTEFENFHDWPAKLSDLRAAKPPKPKTPYDYQRTAISQVCEGFQSTDRGQLIMACGTGKTLTAWFIREKLAAERTLVLVPSLSLLKQTMREWRTANVDVSFEALPVCSDDTVRGDEDAAITHITYLGEPAETDPDAIAAFLRRRTGPRVVFSTYQSSPQIAEAFKLNRVPGFDLVVADEAHRVAGPVKSDFASVLDPAKIKSKRLLFMTATPRIYSARIKKIGEKLRREYASMDDHTQFGPIFHQLRFSEAIEQKLLTDYQVAVVGVDDATYRSWAERGTLVTLEGETSITDARHLAGQIGLAKAMAKYDMRRLISFHGRVARAKDFAKSMPQVIAWMPARLRPKGHLWSAPVSGAMSAGERQRLLQQLKCLEDGDRGLLTNARCLAEGVDVPALDGVAFIDPRRSEVDIVQAVGRAIRKTETKKIGTIVLPVFVGADDDPEIVLEDSVFKPVWDVVNALRSHDDVLGLQLDEFRRELGRQRGRPIFPPKIHLDLPVTVSRAFAAAFEVRLVEQTTESWEFWYGLMQRFVEDHGHGRVAALYKTPDGYPLGRWVNKQRTRYGDDLLPPERINLLESLGPSWSWDARGDRWEKGFTRLTEYVAENDTALVPDLYKSPDGFALGKWVGNQRTQYSKGKVSEKHRVRLESIHPSWSWNTKVGAWDDGFDHMRSFVDENDSARVPRGYKCADGYSLYGWVASQRRAYGKKALTTEQIRLLEDLHPTWSWNTRVDYPKEGMEALSEFIAARGHARVPFSYRSPGGFTLGSWVSNLRHLYRGGNLDNDLQRRLEKSHPTWSWDPFTDRWEEGFEHLCSFVEKNGHARVPSGFKTAEGYALGTWASQQRAKYRKRRLDADRVARLEGSHESWLWNPRDAQWEEGFQHLCAYVAEFGSASPPVSYVVPKDNYPLGRWVAVRRNLERRGKMDKSLRDRLTALPGWRWSSRKRS